MINHGNGKVKLSIEIYTITLFLFDTMQSSTLPHMPIFRCSAFSQQSSSAKFALRDKCLVIFFFFKCERVLTSTKHTIFAVGFVFHCHPTL